MEVFGRSLEVFESHWESLRVFEEVLSVPLVFHMNSSGLQWTLSQTLVGSPLDSIPYLEILWELFQKRKYIKHLHRTLNMIKLH